MAARLTKADRESTRLNADAIRARCQGSLIAFVEEFWTVLEPARPFAKGWAIEAVADHLEAVTAGDIQYLLITIPPGMMKSLMVAVFWPAWEWGPKKLPSNGFLTSSFSGPNVLRDNVKMRRLIESEKFRMLWPELVLASDQNAKTKFENTSRGYREGRAFASMTGGRGDRVIIDDPHSVDTAESDTERASTVKTFREAIPDRLNDMTKSAIVVIMQRLHEDDVAGQIIKLRLPYVHLNLPMEYDPKRHCTTRRKDGSVLFTDPRTVDGELLFPERFPRSVIGRDETEGLKKVKGAYAYAGQYQQRPTGREGGLFKRAWFAGKIVDRASVPLIAYRRVRAYDLAGTKPKPGRSPDWTVGARMLRHGTDYYIEGVDRRQDSPGSIQANALALAETDPPGTTIRLPQDPGQAGVAQVESWIKALAGFTVVAKPPTGAKDVRATPLATQVEHGNVYLVNSGPPEDGLDAWIEVFIDELCAFPNGSNDDQVDAAADAFNELAIGNSARFDSQSAGTREVIQSSERDSRYRFDDTDEEFDDGGGWGSARSHSVRI